MTLDELAALAFVDPEAALQQFPSVQLAPEELARAARLLMSLELDAATDAALELYAGPVPFAIEVGTFAKCDRQRIFDRLATRVGSIPLQRVLDLDVLTRLEQGGLPPETVTTLARDITARADASDEIKARAAAILARQGAAP